MTSSVPAGDPAFLERLRRAFRGASLLGLAQIGGLAVFLIVGETLRAKTRPFFGFLSSSLTSENRIILRYAFFAAAVALILLLRFLHGRRLRVIGAIDDRPAALSRLFDLTVLTLCLAEIPALLGLILFLIAGYNRDFYILLFVSLFLLFMYLPRLKNWEDILEHRPPACPL